MREVIVRTWVVWYWNDRDLGYRVGKVFKNKLAAEQFADSLKHWEFIGITYSTKIYSFAY